MGVDVYLSVEKIQKRIEELGQEISKDYGDREIHVIGVLNGSFMFAADLIRQIKSPLNIDFLAASSYEGTESSGELKIERDIKSDLKGKDVLLIEDIIDTGLTIKEVKKLIESRGASSVKVASFLFKPARLKHPGVIDYLGFEIEDHFVVGYGLDFNGLYRELPYVGVYSGD